MSATRSRVLSRVLHAIAVVMASVTLTFFAMRFVPGDPLDLMAERSGRSAAATDAVRERTGLNRPIGAQYVHYLSGIARGDLGTSFGNGQRVDTLVMAAIRHSLLLGVAATVLATALGVAVGSVEGWWGHSRLARFAGDALTALYAVPEFVLALVLMFALAYSAGWFPVGGVYDPILQYTGSAAERIGDVAWHLVLPAVTLALGWGAAIARQQRGAVRDIVAEPFVRTAFAKGVPASSVFMRHALWPSLPAAVATIGLMLPALVGGAVVVELIYSWPGVGSLLVQAIAARDYAVVNGAMLVVGVVVALGSLAADLLLYWLDPRVRVSNA